MDDGRSFYTCPKEQSVIQRQLKVMFATFPYGGVGASSLEVPDMRHWETRNVLWMSKDKRIQPFDDWLPNRDYIKLVDTPIPMCRNDAVLTARQQGADVLVMLDCDMRPDCEFGVDPLAKPFLPTAFDFLYNHWETGPVVLAAPYCGASPHNNVFVFHWDSKRNPREDILDIRLEQYTREQAIRLGGIQPVAAIGTGLMMFDMRIFDLVKPPWFYYTYNGMETKKLATEDCTFTRDVSMLGHLGLGYEPLLCLWDSWAGHWKPELVRKPAPLTIDMISHKYQKAMREYVKGNEKVYDVRKSFVIENNVKLPEEWAEGKSGKATWLMGKSDGVLQVAGDFIDPLAKERMIDECGEAYVETRIGTKLSTKQSRFEESWNLLLMEPDEAEALMALVNEGKQKQPRVIELGSWVGLSAVMLAEQCKAEVTCVDSFKSSPGDPLHAVAQNFGVDIIRNTFKKNAGKRYKKTIKLVEADTQAAVKQFQDGAYDFVWVDADHRHKQAKADMEAYLPKLKPGGVMAGHDFKDERWGVEKAVREVFGHDFEVRDGVWFHRVPGPGKPQRKPATKNRRRKALPAVSKVAPVHKKVVRKRHNTLSRMPAGRSRVPQARSRRKAKN